MVRAILAGQKTQTRRAVKPAGADHLFQFRGKSELRGADEPTGEWAWCGSPGVVSKHIRCPYGQPGDRLWVRETWNPDPPCDGTWGYTAWAGCKNGQIAGVPERFRHPAFCNYAANWLHGPIHWTPSIHMPRWASRITLEITSVRVERLCAISEADAQAEGCALECMTPTGDDGGSAIHGPGGFSALWSSINGAESWDANPWVWVVEFRRAAAIGNKLEKSDG